MPEERHTRGPIMAVDFIEGARRKVSVDGSWCGAPELALSHPNDSALRKAYILFRDVWCDTPGFQGYPESE